jgi:hypothetical protein
MREVRASVRRDAASQLGIEGAVGHEGRQGELVVAIDGGLLLQVSGEVLVIKDFGSREVVKGHG